MLVFFIFLFQIANALLSSFEATPERLFIKWSMFFLWNVSCYLVLKLNCWAANINWVCWVSENIINLPNDICSAVCTNKTYHCPWFDHRWAMKPLFVWLHNFLSHECSSTCNNEIWFILIYQPRTQARPANDYKINHCIVTSAI